MNARGIPAAADGLAWRYPCPRLGSHRPSLSATAKNAQSFIRICYHSAVPTGCQGCYVPLLITQHSLEEIAKGDSAALGVYIITYERDSIWEVKGAVPIEPIAIEAPPRIVHLNGNAYRYQELFPSEVVKLIENPGGTIPISRTMVMNKAVPGASLPQLTADFRDLQDHTHTSPSVPLS